MILSLGCGSCLARLRRCDLRYRAGVPPTLTMFHNPRCSKSRAALEILQEHGLSVGTDLVLVDYLAEPPTAAQLQHVVEGAAESPREFLRLGPDVPVDGIDLDDPIAVAAVLASNPAALQRPIVTDGVRSVIGRPPERVKELLGG